MNNIQTAEEFLKNKVYIAQDDIEDVHDSMSNVVEAMLEFTKLHVEAARKEILEKSTAYYYIYGTTDDINRIEEYDLTGLKCTIDKESILDAYPLENIK